MSNDSLKLSSKTRRLTEAAVMVALATVLSIIPIVKMPFGGSVTLFSMLPIIIIAYRYNWGFGLFTGFVYSLIQLMLDTKTLSYATSAKAVVAIILLDYIAAFTVLGFAGLFKKNVKNQAVAATLGTIGVCVLRYICHVITGCTVWAGVSIPSSDGFIYSLGYNAAYMVPETIITAAVAYWIFSFVNFNSIELVRLKKDKNTVTQSIMSALSILSVIVAVLFDAVYLFLSIQNENGFDITLISNANFGLIGIVTVAGAVIAAIFYYFSKKFNKIA